MIDASEPGARRLRMTLDGQLHWERTNGTVRFELTVSNVGPEPAAFQFNSGQKAEFVIYADDEEIWRWSDGRMFTQALETDRLEPGDAVTYTSTWDDPAPGDYVVEGAVAATNVELTERTNLTI